KDNSPGVRMAAVLALRRLERPEIAAFLNESDPLIVAEAARAINDLPIVSALPPLAALLKDADKLSKLPAGDDKKPGPRDAIIRRAINANFRLGTPASASALVAFAASGVLPGSLRAEAISALGDWAQPSGRDSVTGLWRPLAKRD